MEKLAISFWTVFMHEICPEVIVESKINNRELVKAVKGLTDTEYRLSIQREFERVGVEVSV